MSEERALGVAAGRASSEATYVADADALADPKHALSAAHPPPPPPPPPPAEARRTKAETVVVMVSLACVLLLAALDMTIVTTAVPAIAADLHSSSSGYVWIGSSYLLGNAAFVPMWGKVSDIFGRKSIIICAAVVFLIGSALCGASVSMPMLIAARAVQGVGAGGLIALPNIAVSDLFSQRSRPKYLGILGGVWAIASAIGPLLGGAFASRLSWRWCFYINLPVGGVSLAVMVFVLKLHNPRTPVVQGLAAIDWVGSLLVVGGTLMLLLGLEFGGVTHPWTSPTVICLIVFGLATIALFAVYEGAVARYPIMPVSLFREKTSISAYILSFMHAFTFMGASYFLPLYFQSVMGVNALLSGVYLLPFVLSLSLVSFVSGLTIKRTGNYKYPIMVGLLAMTLGYGLFIDLGHDRNWAKIVLFQIIAGAGVGPNFQAPLVALQTNVEPRMIGSATASFSFLRQIGTSISVVVGGVVFNNQMQSQAARLARLIGPEQAARFNGDMAAASVHYVGDLPNGTRHAVQAAYWDALQKMFVVYTCFAFAGFLVSFFVEQKTLSKTHTEHKTGLETLKARVDDSHRPSDEEKGGAR